MDKIEFKKGIYKLNDEPNFNFQLNRLVMWDGGDIEDIKEISEKIVDSTSWKKELIALGDKANGENRTKEAIAYYRMSEFFMYDGDSDKKKYYALATTMFYEYYADYFSKGIVEKQDVPYENITLPVMLCKSKSNSMGTLLLHGGNDSYFEELFFPMLYFAGLGFDVYLFEGPGQGGVLRLQNKHFTHQWEKPVKAILDHFNLESASIIGASLGGMLAPRAAAFDKRIKNTIAWSVFPNFLDVALSFVPTSLSKFVRGLLNKNCEILLKPILAIVQKKNRKNEMFTWAIGHGMYAYQGKSVYDYLKILSDYQMLDIAPLITQNVYIIGAREDHFIDYHLVYKEIDALVNAKSVTFRLFTNKECAGNHCNVGNTKLALDSMADWLKSMECTEY